MSIQVKELAFIFHLATDIPRARQLYEGLLCLKTGMQSSARASDGIRHRPGACALQPMPVKPALALALEVADLDIVLDAARAASAKITMEVLEFPGCGCSLEDPDGNGIILHLRKARGCCTMVRCSAYSRRPPLVPPRKFDLANIELR